MNIAKKYKFLLKKKGKKLFFDICLILLLDKNNVIAILITYFYVPLHYKPNI